MTENNEEPTLEDLKKEYSEIQKKHNLPSFDELNQDFHIERLAKLETDCLIREIRKFLADKLQNYSRFIESVLNPSGASMFIYSVLKSINEEDKKVLSEIFKKLSRIEVDLIDLDLYYVEQKEIEFVKSFYLTWQEMKKDLSKILESIKVNWDKETGKDTKAYFG